MGVPELRLYSGRPVCRRVLYFLHCGRISDVPGPDA